MMSVSPTTPPITPPAIAPVLVVLFDDDGYIVVLGVVESVA